MKFKDLFEMAWARDGDYDFGNLNYIKNRVLSKEGAKIFAEINHRNTIYYFEKMGSYVLAMREIEEPYPTKSNPNETKIRLKVVGATKISGTDSYRRMGLKNTFVVKGVEVEESERRNGIAKLMYIAIVKYLNYTLVGDSIQYENARNLWISLSKHPGFIVDVADLGLSKIVYKNIELTPDDKRIWSYEDSTDKEELKIGRLRRLILVDVK